MFDRRRFLSILLPLVATPRAAWGQSQIGVIGPSTLPSALSQLPAIEEGDGPRRIDILFSPGCDHSLEMWTVSQGWLPETKFRWIPFSGLPSPSATSVLARLIEQPTPEALRLALSGSLAQGVSSPFATQAAMRQDDLINRVIGRQLWEATGRSLAAPTLVYRTSTDIVRIVRGSVKSEMLETMLKSAL